MNATKTGAALLVGALTLMLSAPSVLATSEGTMEAFQTAERSGDLSERLTPFAYFEEGDFFFAVDTRAAQYAKDGEMVPIPIALANLNNERISVSVESFTLQSSDGTNYPAVSTETFNRNYNRSRVDIRLKDSFVEALRGRFNQRPFRGWSPYPVSGSSTLAEDSVELAQTYWTEATLYFSMPADGVIGKKLSLVVSPDGADESFVVTFFVK